MGRTRGTGGSAGFKPPPSGGANGVKPRGGVPIVGYYVYVGEGTLVETFDKDRSRVIVECLDSKGASFPGGRMEQAIPANFLDGEHGWRYGEWQFQGQRDYPRNGSADAVAVRIVTQVFVETSSVDLIEMTRSALVDSITLPIPSPIVVPGSFAFVDVGDHRRLTMKLKWWDPSAVGIVTSGSDTVWRDDVSRVFFGFRAADGTAMKNLSVNIVGDAEMKDGGIAVCQTQPFDVPKEAVVAHVTVLLVLDAKIATFLGRYHVLHGEPRVSVHSGTERRFDDAQRADAE